MRLGIACISIALAIFLAACSGTLRNSPDSTLPQSVDNTGRTSGRTTKAHASDSVAPCPDRAIFVRRYGEIRGYPLDSNGETKPCAVISGPLTNVSDNLAYGNIAISSNGLLHALSFQASDQHVLTIDAPDADGNERPRRLVGVGPDAVALAVDSDITDYVVASENYLGDNCWYIAPAGATSTVASNCDTNLTAIVALAVDKHDDLIVAGADAITGGARIDVISNPAAGSFAVVRSIGGSQNEITPGSSMALAVAPNSDDLYVFSRSFGKPAIINVFKDDAQGNAEPSRTIVGSKAELPLSAFAANVLAVDDADFLYITSDTGTIFVYGPGATGEAVPVRQITDTGAASQTFAAGIAVRL